MGYEVKTVTLKQRTNIEKLGYEISDWMLNNHKFSLDKREWHNQKYFIQLSKSNMMRQLSGLVYTFKIELEQTEKVLTIIIDDGDLRNQLVALGLAVFVAWPLLLTAGWGMYAKGDFRQKIFGKIEKMAKSQH
ncbi:MAG: hypothetical protein MGG11_02275 [Trichodesmium sp. MAG_R03]|nr:hypothetical protein [Trichodesmium sp. MAG_R03]MDE5080593.1 hypothetical protein [Trichodesmium sp. St18_bin1]MDE5124123.1 hypothetical protein [Trichodesmium sp. St19_bin1]